MKLDVVWTRGTRPDTGETSFIVQCGQGLRFRVLNHITNYLNFCMYGIALKPTCTDKKHTMSLSLT